MVYGLTYRRPAHVPPPSRDSISGDEKQKSIDHSVTSSSSGMSHGIPDALSFDKILAGGVCPPCTVRDFINYLKYIEHAAENLQFFLWYQDYCQRFNALPESERALSPEWTVAQAEAEALAAQTTTKPVKVSPAAAAAFKGTDFDSKPRITDSEKTNPFYTPPRTPSDASRHDIGSAGSNNDSNADWSAGKTGFARKAEGAFEDAGLKWQPFTVQPYREEISRIITIYIADGGVRQLNLSARERNALLHALENTTHPSAFRDVISTVEWSLRCQAHPNFIRWTICNGNRPRVIFARGLGVGGIVGGLIAAVLITLSSASRPWRILSFLGFFIGIATLVAAWKGMCVVLHGMHHRHLRPWELFATDDEPQEMDLKKESFESIGSSNSWEDEPWVAKYEKRNIIRKVFDREVWIQEPALRQIQDTIFLQAILAAFLLSAVIVGIFCAFPSGRFY
ncbi:hypothetical protein H2201_003094 [Coniosporium apollinis]|uniref:RGS domain-containing protein n=2 Tax=Coniosporium TaxID=2810619 RepID=A0ABQ9NWC5_9PEZI|nr:hypothetical protein H2199_008436 [Cladosporium sp. JES 115]KAJ9666690.1 hypothetical protein H2201_003094 [Coniosporium apollinis]